MFKICDQHAEELVMNPTSAPPPSRRPVSRRILRDSDVRNAITLAVIIALAHAIVIAIFAGS
jgi:hypothetical protein